MGLPFGSRGGLLDVICSNVRGHPTRSRGLYREAREGQGLILDRVNTSYIPYALIQPGTISRLLSPAKPRTWSLNSKYPSRLSCISERYYFQILGEKSPLRDFGHWATMTSLRTVVHRTNRQEHAQHCPYDVISSCAVIYCWVSVRGSFNSCNPRGYCCTTSTLELSCAPTWYALIAPAKYSR